MTIRMLQSWNGYPQQTIVTLSGPEETRLVGLGLATHDLDGANDGETGFVEYRKTLTGGGEILGPNGPMLSTTLTNTLDMIGNSIPSGSTPIVGGYDQSWTGSSLGPKLCARLGQRIKPGSVVATGGYTATQIKANHLAAALASRSKYAVIIMTENSVGSSTETPDDVVACIESFVAPMVSQGKIPFVLGPLPAAGFNTLAASNYWHELVKKTREMCALYNVPFDSGFRAYGDYTRADGYPVWTAGFTDASVHPCLAGDERLIDRVLLPVFESLVPPNRTFTDCLTSDKYNAVDNPNFTGSGGNGSQVTGTVPAGWSVFATGAGNSGAISLVDDAAGGAKWLRCTYTGSLAAQKLQFISPDFTLDSVFTIGKLIEGLCEMKVEAGATGLRNMECYITMTGSGAKSYSHLEATNAFVDLPPGQRTDRTPPIAIAPATTAIKLVINFYGHASVAPNFAALIRCPVIQPVAGV